MLRWPPASAASESGPPGATVRMSSGREGVGMDLGPVVRCRVFTHIQVGAPLAARAQTTIPAGATPSRSIQTVRARRGGSGKHQIDRPDTREKEFTQ
jgi:hypothetical protein